MTPTKLVLIGLQVIAMIISRGSIAWGVLTAAILGYFVCRERFSRRLWVGMGLCLIPLLIGFMIEGVQLLDSARRFEAYSIFMNAWWDIGHWALGLGPGSFRALSGVIQKANNFMVNPDGTMWLWPWIHSDWLEGVFTLGFLGGILMLSIFLEILLKLYRKNDQELFAIMCGLGASAIFNYPSKYFVTALLVGLFSVLSYRK